MKKYDKDSGKWIEEIVVEQKLAKRKLCKGGKEHDWVLCLPAYAKSDTALGLDKVEEYYRIEDERADMETAFDERLEALGIESNSYRFSKLLGRRRSYICSVCLKQG